jgi:hypothetical protein
LNGLDPSEENPMRTVILAATAALIMSVQMAATAKAEDTTIIKKDVPEDSTTVIKKRDDVNLLPVPHTEEKKVIIHKDHDEE